MSNMVVRTNVFSLNAHRNMKNTGLEQQRAANRLASGFRINSAADDAAGLAISETMRAQIRGLDQASRNTQDGQAMIVVTEGGLDEIGNIVQRVRELVVQASNDTNVNNQRQMIEAEISQLATEIYDMRQRVEFNTNRVLSIGTWTMATGASALNFSTTVSAGPGIANPAAEFHPDATTAEILQTGIDNVMQGRGATLTGSAFIANAPAADATTVAWFQVGANQEQGIQFDFARVSGMTLIAHAVVDGISTAIASFGNTFGDGIGYGARISLMIEPLQNVLDGLNTIRAELGAVSNRMDHTMRNLDLSSENLQDAESRVRNADIAREMMRFTMQNVLSQAATSMLAQANQIPQNLLQILR